MNTSFTAPIGDSKRIDNVELIPINYQVCTLVTLVDIGTQETNFGLRRMCNLMFEFPQHKRVFYEGDEPVPACVFIGETLSLSDKANLRTRWVNQMLGRNLTDSEAKSFDIGQFLGKHFVANIVHNESKDGKTYANIQSLTPLNTQNMVMFGLQQPAIAIHHELKFFHLSQGFENANFGALGKKLQEKIKNSVEGKQHASINGKFAESTNSQQNTPKLVWLDTASTYDAHKQQGWTDQQLVDAGKARWEQPVAPPQTATPPVQAPPTAVPPVSAPIQTPPPPQVAPPPVSAPPQATTEPQLVFHDSQYNWEMFKAKGWTKQQVVDAQFAVFQ